MSTISENNNTYTDPVIELSEKIGDMLRSYQVLNADIQWDGIDLSFSGEVTKKVSDENEEAA